MWYKAIEQHHRTEEDCFFPVIERTTGEKNIMRENSEQHDAFQPGMEEYRYFVEGCLAGQQEYYGKGLVRILDDLESTL